MDILIMQEFFVTVDISQRIKYFMRLKGIENVRQLHKLSKVPYGSCYRMYHGQVNPGVDNVRKLAKFFGVSASALIEEDERLMRIIIMASDMEEDAKEDLLKHAEKEKWWHSKKQAGNY